MLLRSTDKSLAKILSEKKTAIQKLAKAEDIELQKDYSYKVQRKDQKKGAALAMQPFSAGEVYISLEGILDIEKEKAKLQKDLDKLSQLIKAAQTKLENKKFIKNAPQAVLAKERSKLDEFSKKERALKAALKRLS